MNLLTDEDLVSRINSSDGDNRALQTELYKRFKSRVYFKCLSILHNREEALDLAHDVFIKILTKLSSFKERSSLSLWIHSITYNTCISYLKKKKKLSVFEYSEAEKVPEESDSEILEKKFMLELDLQNLNRSLEYLREEDRILLLMRYMDGLSTKEMCEIVNLKPSALKMRVMRAREKLYNIFIQLSKEE